MSKATVLEQPQKADAGTELFMIPEEVGAELGVTPRRLRQLREAGIGPAYFTIGSAIRYLLADGARWRSEHPNGVRIIRRRRTASALPADEEQSSAVSSAGSFGIRRS